MAQINFKIDKTGNVVLDVEGAVGQACSDLTKPFEMALGVVTDINVKPEYEVILDGTQIHVYGDS
jgi:hypothetical protein